MLETLLPYMPVIIGLLLVGISAALAWIKGKGWLNAQFLDQLNVDVSAAVNETYQTYVKARKDAAEDGKLTEDEKVEARKLAIDTLKDIGKAKGKNYAKEWLLPVARDLIEKWVSRKKADPGP